MSDAVKYFQKNGLKASKELVDMGFGFCSVEGGLSFHTEQLKQLVESHEMVEKWQGLEASKIKVNLLHTFGFHTQADQLQQAITDVESCMGVSSESD